MLNEKIKFILFFIFILALSLRFLYFPDNIYFGFDQARDAFISQSILRGDFKLIGPPTTFEGLFHGPLYYYIYAPIYWIGGGDPSFAAGSLRIFNAAGIILIFALATLLFNKYVGLISAYLYAVSFEQTQFSMYFNHPSFGVISILTLFLGLSFFIFGKKDFGLIIALLGLGLSIQFEFILTYLVVTFFIICLFFRKSFYSISPKITLTAIIIFLLTISTFIIAEIKFGFRSIHSIFQLLFEGPEKSLTEIIQMYLFEMGQVIKFSLTGIDQLRLVTGFILLVLFLFLLFSKVKKQIIFLGIWFFSGIIIYLISGGGSLNVDIIQYHPNVGISLSLIIFVSYIIYIIGKRGNYFIAIMIITLISLANFYLMQKINPKGSMPEINAQSSMLLSDEKKVIDYIYIQSEDKPFSVKAVTLPFYINTTWSYLFEWYGAKNYGYLPVWGGKNALGYPGNLQIMEAQDKLPEKRFLIIEPIRGIPIHLINDFLKEESYFTSLQSVKEIGNFKVQKRVVR